MSNTGGNDNTANGAFALLSNITGGFNTATGLYALSANTSGRNNVALGAFAGSSVSTADNVICIGSGVQGANVSNSCFIGNIYGRNNGFGALPVYVNSSHALGTVSSSRRFKDDIKPMDKASELLFALKPVTFRYKKELDPAGIAQFGLVAEDVEKVNPDLMVRDKEGKPYSVRYDQVNAMLLNEFLKEHRKVEEQNRKIQEQEATINRLQKGMERVVARLEEQASQIEKVSAQLEVSQPAPKTVAKSR